MVSEVSKNVDRLEAEIKEHRARLEQIEEQYNLENQKFEDNLYQLKVINQDFNRYYEEKFEEALSYLRQGSGDVSEELMSLNRIIEEYVDATEVSYRREYQVLENKMEKQEYHFHKERGEIEQKIDDCFAQRRRLLLGGEDTDE